MISHIKESAEEVGINLFVSNSEEKIETQLNRLTREEDLPIMLVTWDIDVTLSFDENGFLNNPSAKIVSLLLSKPEDTSKKEAQDMSDEMAELFQIFIQNLYNKLIPYQKSNASPINNATYKHVPKHGAGKHSGVMGRWDMSFDISRCSE